MVGKQRSGLANDRRAYGCTTRCPPTYRVKYDGNGNTSGTAPKDVSYPYRVGATVTVLGNTGSLEKTLFAFAGWNTAADGTGTSYLPGATFIINENTQLYAKWIPTYTVTYYGNGSTGGSVPIDSSSPYRVGSTVTVLANSGSLAISEFAFVGWNTQANGSGTSYSQGNTFTINANTNLYAQWIRTYTVTYNGNGSTSGSVPTDSSSPYRAGLSVTVLGNPGSLAKTNFAFAGWNTRADGLGEPYSQGNTFTINANTILYAKWTPIYTVTYNGNGSTSGSVPAVSSYAAGSTVTVPGNTGSLAKTNFAFAGWNREENGSGTNYSQGNTFTINANTILYAKWIPTYTVTYNGNGSTSGSVPAVSSYAAGSTVTVPGNTGSLMQPGLVFDNWNTEGNGDGTSYSEGDTFTINADEILYAQWIIAPLVAAPTALSSVGGDQEAYILFTQVGTVTNYEYSTDDGDTFVAFDPPQIYSPVNIKTLSSDGLTPLTNGTTYTVRLKAVNSGETSDQSEPVNVIPEITELLTDNRRIYLDANFYSGSGTAWTNLVSSGDYSATLNGSPTFNTTDPSNNYFEFNPGALTGQFAQITQHPNINPVLNQPFTIQMWVRINNVGLQGGNLVSKVFFDGEGGDYDGYALYYLGNTGLRLHSNRSRVNYFTSVTGVLSSGWALYTTNVQIGNGGGRENKIFVNARQLGVTQLSNGQIMPNNISQDAGTISSTKNMTFPRGFPQGTSEYGKCDIGEFYYYNAELTTTQIIQNFDATKHRYNV